MGSSFMSDSRNMTSGYIEGLDGVTSKMFMRYNNGENADLVGWFCRSFTDIKRTSKYSELIDSVHGEVLEYIINGLKTGNFRKIIKIDDKVILVDNCGSVFWFNLYRDFDDWVPCEISETFIRGWYDHSVELDNYGEIMFACSRGSDFYKKIYSKSALNFYPTHKNKEEQPMIYLLQENGGSLRLVCSPIKKADTDILPLYNEDMEAVDSRIKYNLLNRDSGLYLFHGEAGTGKTSYIRHLIYWLSTQGSHKKVIYLPPNLINIVSDSSFVGLLSSNPHSVVVIEDAENILKTREAGGNSAVANILNSTDGLLGDVLKAQFICTFNASRCDIDEALFRSGRLIQEYKFGKLDEARSKKVWVDRLGRPEEDFPNRAMSLADLFNYGERIEYEEKKSNGFGFVPQY